LRKLFYVKVFALIAVISAAMGLVACGGGSSESAQAEKPTEPTVEPPSGPPPTELVINDIEVGSGPAAKPGDEMAVHYVAVDEAGKEAYTSWTGFGPLTFKLGAGQFFPAWEEGLEGMKVGGRRELQVPADMAFGSGALFYVVDFIRYLGEAAQRLRSSS
jgi:peptidylprolyl isomerase